jgi:hypothetical protein
MEADALNSRHENEWTETTGCNDRNRGQQAKKDGGCKRNNEFAKPLPFKQASQQV